MDWLSGAKRRASSMAKNYVLCPSFQKTKAYLLRFLVAPIVLINSAACTDQAFHGRSLPELETNLSRFFKSDANQLTVSEVDGKRQILGFCVLGPYESEVPEHSNQLIPVNAFLREHNVMGEETKWHLVVLTNEGLWVARFRDSSVPLISPRPSYGDKHSCMQTRTIRFSKIIIDPIGRLVDPEDRTRIQIQPGD